MSENDSKKLEVAKKPEPKQSKEAQIKARKKEAEKVYSSKETLADRPVFKL